MKFILLLSLITLPLTLALPFSLPDSISSLFHLRPRQTAALNSATDTLLFQTTMAQFQLARNAKVPSGLDWSSDDCSSAPEDPFGFNFAPCCQRHDFGYRNTKIQSRFDANKAKIDSNFKKDMFNVCATKSLLRRPACKALAEVYYHAVKEFGHKKARKIDEELEAAAAQQIGVLCGSC